jgi:hypothetical protein
LRLGAEYQHTVGFITTVPIGISGLIYIFTTFAPVIYPQSPYQNSFSGLIWYLAQKLHGRTYKDRNFAGVMKPVSSNMAQGQLELAMEETEERKGRDDRAIQWLIGNPTEEAEMELFVMAIPGSFNAEWGIEVWKKVFNRMSSEDKDKSPDDPTATVEPVTDTTVSLVGPPPLLPPHIRTVSNIFDSISRRVRTRAAGDSSTNTMAPFPAPHPPNDHILHTTSHYYVRRLSAHVAHMLETCHDRRLFANDDLWRKRTRACIDSTASLVSWANAELDWFGDIVKLLGDIANVEKTRESSLLGIDQFFVMRWTCLSLMSVRPILARNSSVQMYARMAVALFGKGEDDTNHEHRQTLTVARKIDETFERAWGCLVALYLALTGEENLAVGQVVTILRNHEYRISELEQIEVEADSLGRVDLGIFRIQSCIDADSHGIVTRQLPGVEFDDFHPENIHFGQTIDWFRDPHKRQLILPGHKLRSICSLIPTFRDILEGRWNEDAYQEMLKNLRALVHVPAWQGNLLRRQLWRLQDLCDGGGLGLRSSCFFSRSSSCYPRRRRRNPPTRRYTSARSERSHPTGRNTNTRSERNASCSTLPRHTAASSPALISLRASRTSSWCYWETFSKDRLARISTMPYSSSGISIGSTIALDIGNGGKRSWRLSFRPSQAHHLHSLLDLLRFFNIVISLDHSCGYQLSYLYKYQLIL